MLFVINKMSRIRAVAGRLGAAGRARRGLALVWLACGLIAGCRSEMYDQPRYEPYQASDYFDDGASARHPVPGTVARGELDADDALCTGRLAGKLVDAIPIAIDAATLDRGQERYGIFCAPCHGAVGDGEGMIVKRGFSRPPSFHSAKARGGPSEPLYDDLRKAPAGHFFEVITKGHGAMYSYAARIPVHDRWAIVAYVRALQLSQAAPAADLSEEDRAELAKSALATPESPRP